MGHKLLKKHCFSVCGKDLFIYLILSGHVYISPVLIAQGLFLLALTAAGTSLCSAQNAVPSPFRASARALGCSGSWAKVSYNLTPIPVL